MTVRDDFGLTGPERAPRLRALQALALCYGAPALLAALRDAEADDHALAALDAGFAAAPALVRRRMTAAFLRLHPPAKRDSLCA